jgi:dipeptidyl aminopeptidase/acylaminoacyl peptidase
VQSEHDEQLFDYYCLSELVSVEVRRRPAPPFTHAATLPAVWSLSPSHRRPAAPIASPQVSTGEATPLGPARAYTASTPSPDGRFLLVAWLERPYSYTVPCGRFPKRVQLWDRAGACVRELAALPLADDIPIAFDSCRRGPRGIEWRDDKPAQVAWLETQDGGDPAVAVSPRDKVFVLDADAAGDPAAAPRCIAGTDMRCGGVAWGGADLALLYEAEWKTRRSRSWVFAPDDPAAEKSVLFDRNYEDSYSDPGSPMQRRTSQGTYVLAQVNGQRQLLLQGGGASPEGNRPFLDVLDLDTRETRRIWQSAPPHYETISSILSDLDDCPITLDALRVLSSRESVEEPPQYSIKTFTDGGAAVAERLLSAFPHPYPTLRGLSKQIIQYQRADGVDLNATLYLPPGYDLGRDGPLPALLWAYPREFKSKAAAGQLRKSPHTFASVGSSSPLLFLARGYAVLDGPGFPIVAEGEEEPNDTYVEQLVASARAAVDELGRLGVVDPKRIAVAGHSYGAFMSAGLLAHAPGLFACGIARSGAYNRTMTPFGFQSEERTIWQAPDIYLRMSPFM